MSPNPLPQYSVTLETSVRDVMQRIDRTGFRILTVVDEEERLVGVVTDGDVRRFILAGGDLGDPVARICNRDPRKVRSGASRDEIRHLMATHKVTAVPEVDPAGRVVAVHSWETLLQPEAVSRPQPQPITGASVVIMAGGLGTRLDPLTRILPKALVPVGEKPMIEHIIERFAAYGLEEFHLVLHHRAEFIKAFFATLPDPGYRVVFHVEPQPLGTIGGLALVDPAVLQPEVFVSNCDILVDDDYHRILEHHRRRGADLTLVGASRSVQVPYGVLRLDPAGDLAAIDEKPRVELLVNTGMYVLRRETMAEIPRGQPSHVTDLMGRLLGKKRRVSVASVADGAWMDVGEWGEYDKTWNRLTPPGR